MDCGGGDEVEGEVEGEVGDEVEGEVEGELRGEAVKRGFEFLFEDRVNMGVWMSELYSLTGVENM